MTHFLMQSVQFIFALFVACLVIWCVSDAVVDSRRRRR
jgi:hypothetical protein